MDVTRGVFGVMVLLMMVDSLLGDHEYFVTTPEQRTMPLLYETVLTCEMNFAPDKYEWRFYPLSEDDAYNPRAVINLGTAKYTVVSHDRAMMQKSKSILKIRVNSTSSAGDYQCLAFYGALVVASIPWRITIAHSDPLPHTPPRAINATVGNTLAWRCDPPAANPPSMVDYYRDGQYLSTTDRATHNRSLVLTRVGLGDGGVYSCGVVNNVLGINERLDGVLDLRVNKIPSYGEPYFIVKPVNEFVVVKGASVFMECAAAGYPIPQTTWYKKTGQIPYHRAAQVEGGLKISSVEASDAGTYICNHTNVLGTVSYEINLIYNEEPSIECLVNSSSIKQGGRLDLECVIRGTPEPEVSWLLNGKSALNDTAIEVHQGKIVFHKVEKRHAGNLQCFASNRVKTVYSRISITVIPLTTNIDVSTASTKQNHKHKGRKNHSGNRKIKNHSKIVLIPPSKPVISRKDDETVVVRWNVTSNKGLPIAFFKIQYQDLGPATASELHKGRWKTSNEDIQPHARSFEVRNLKSNHFYKFRIAAVYANMDNKKSNNSDKFLLQRLDFEKKNPLIVPKIVSTETVNETAVKIYWDYIPNNISISGFYIYYLSATSAGDFDNVIVEGEDVRSYVLNYLEPDTYYDIKMQSFTPKMPSYFSPPMKAKTKATLSTTTLPPPRLDEAIKGDTSAGISNLYVIIAAGVIGGGLLICTIALLFVCRKWKKKKSSDDPNKPAVDDRHISIQNESDYVVNSKSLSRTNGCAISANRMTITANPLADAENKTQTMIEMSCLTSQNNNCTQQPSVSGQMPSHHRSEERAKQKLKNRENAKRNRQKSNDNPNSLSVYKQD